ncbi:MAG: membrane protease YdiL (CAAX protease family) [Halobacteriales archaeon]|jgi:membrane protease YdiL (CAAX protease family)
MTDATTPTRRSANPVTVLADDHPAATFFAATLAISWGVWTVGYALTGGGTLTEALIIPGGFGPALGAALVTWLRGDSLRAWAASIVDWRVSPRWYLAAFGLPALAATGASGLYFLGGGPVTVDRLLRMVPLLPVLVLVTALVGGGNEEPGWRGFALPHLTERFSAFTASLVIGVVWAVWHFPLFLMGAPRLLSGSLLLYSVVVVAVSILLTWVYESTGGSVLLALLFHGAINTATSFVPVPRGAIEQWGLLADLGIVTAVLVVTLAVVAYDARGDDGVFDLPVDAATAATVAVAVLGFAVSVATVASMPDSVVVHWTVTSSLALTPDDTTSARLALSVLPVTATGIAFCSAAAVGRLRERSDATRIVRAVALAVVAFLTLTHVGLVVGNVL